MPIYPEKLKYQRMMANRNEVDRNAVHYGMTFLPTQDPLFAGKPYAWAYLRAYLVFHLLRP